MCYETSSNSAAAIGITVWLSLQECTLILQDPFVYCTGKQASYMGKDKQCTFLIVHWDPFSRGCGLPFIQEVLGL